MSTSTLNGNTIIAALLAAASEPDNGRVTASVTVDWAKGNFQKVTLGASGVTINMPPAGVGWFQLKLVQDAAGGHTMPTFIPAPTWLAGGAPSLSLVPGAVDLIDFYCTGSEYFAVGYAQYDPSFVLPLADLGDGEVNLVPAKAFGSPIHTFTRATTATTFAKLNNPYLRLPRVVGNYASTPDSAAIDTVGDIDIIVKMQADNTIEEVLVAKSAGAPQSSYFFRKSGGAGNLKFVWTEDGTNNIESASTAGDYVVGVDKWVRVTLDVDNGAGGNDTKFYTSNDGVSWTQLGTTITKVGVTSIFSSTAVLEIGSRNNGNTAVLAGKIYYAEVRNGIDGTPVAVFDARDASEGSTSFTSRATGETWTVNRSGTNAAYMMHHAIITKNAGVARSWYWPDTLTYGGYLPEGARTNLCLQSEDLGTTWVLTRATQSANAVVAPDGARTADKLIEDATAANTHVVGQGFTFAAAVHTFSCFLKAGERTWVRMVLNDGTTTWAAYFNLSTGAVGTVTGSAVTSVVAFPNGWYRIAITTNAATLAAAGNVFIRIATADNSDSYTGNGTSGLFAWGAQLEVGTFPSTYIPTTTASVTRNADVLTYPFAGNADATQGTCVATLGTFFSTSSPSTNHNAVGFGATAIGPLYLGNNRPSTRIDMRDGTTEVSKQSLTAMATGIRKRGSSWGTAQNITGDGATVATGAFDGDLGSTAIGIGNSGTGVDPWNGTIKDVAIWRLQVPNDALRALTA